MLVKSISKSEKLELNNEGKSVRLKGDLVKKDQNEIDECTIYVEQIPLNSDHDTIKSIFSKYGHINYISLPRYKQSRQLKQFGFIEFAEKNYVQKCIDDFKKFDGVLNCSKPDKLLSISTFETETKEEEPKYKEEEKKEDANDKKDENMLLSEEQQKSPKDKLQEKEGEEADKDPKKKNRKHKRKNKKQKVIDERAVTMKIMRKTLWKKLRNEYLNLERQKAKEIKKILQETRKVNPKEQLTKKLSPRKSFYKSPSGNDQDPHDSISEEQLETNTGPIVNIKFREPCNDIKELRQEFKQFSYVRNVEIVEEGAQCNVRVSAQSYAQELVNLYSGCEYEANIISGDAEKDYWKRISENKEKNKKKTEINPNRKQRRGREKLAKMIIKASAQHIRFNDNMEVAE
jgi:La-related protein 7